MTVSVTVSLSVTVTVSDSKSVRQLVGSHAHVDMSLSTCRHVAVDMSASRISVGLDSRLMFPGSEYNLQ